VALVTNVLSHYRRRIYELMAWQCEPSPEYTIHADLPKAGRLKSIDPEWAKKPVSEGGLGWSRLKNVSLLGTPFYWQRGALGPAVSRKYDTVIFLGTAYCISTWVGAVLARMRGKRVLMWSHGFTRKERGLKGWIRTRLYKLAHGMLLYGNWARNIMIEKGFDPKTLYVVFNSLDYDKQLAMRESISEQDRREKRAELFANPDWPVVFFIGRLTPQKKLTMILDAADRLRKQGTDLNVLIIGDGPARGELEEHVRENALGDRVVFYGACHSEDELAPLISAADLCVSPGEVGLTAMHSLVYGTPVVTHDNPEKQMPEFEAIIDGRSGKFYPEGSVTGLAETIKAWLELAAQRGRDTIRDDCQEVIDKYYNPHVQIETINAAVTGSKTAEERPLGESQYVRRKAKAEYLGAR
jgi:glycosyltransferase involved in cell wall biosynthesis